MFAGRTATNDLSTVENMTATEEHGLVGPEEKFFVVPEK